MVRSGECQGQLWYFVQQVICKAGVLDSLAIEIFVLVFRQFYDIFPNISWIKCTFAFKATLDVKTLMIKAINHRYIRRYAITTLLQLQEGNIAQVIF